MQHRSKYLDRGLSMSEETPNIILITDIYKLREQKEMELTYYRTRLDELEKKLFFIQKEIDLTNYIIDLVEKEKVENINDLIKEKRS